MAASCAAPRPAPVVERAPPARASAPAPVAAKPAAPRAPDVRPEFYVVKPGDTLYSIALEQGLDYRELAIWNGIDHPGALRQGQQLRLSAPSGAAVAAPLRSAPGTVEAKPLAAGPSAVPPSVAAPPATTSAAMVTEPKGVRLPYSEQALAQLSKPEAAPPARVEAPPVRAEPSRPDTRTETGGESARGPDDLDWGWPVKGKVIGTFSEGSNKGIAISGKLGQPVVASAPGRVIFSGTGIRGFGKLIVIKHNNTYLSVYAHNNELTVKEGQTVAKGQKIAEMGNSDSDQVKLHFEIRRFGKPIDPLKLLPAG
jgi:lipoprotein NlpD